MKMWLERVGLVLLGAALTLGVQLLVLGGDGSVPVLGAGSSEEADEDPRARSLALAEERFRTDLQLALVGFFRLVEMRDFAHLGRDVSIVIPLSDDADRRDVLEAGARRGIRIPRIVVDTEARLRWARAGERLEGMEGGVDPEVYARFQDIRAFLAEHPLPSSSDLAAVSGSDWARPGTVERWVALNEALASAAVGLLSQFRAGL